jgi:DNA-directed RNA polymerase II subunit RPB2
VFLNGNWVGVHKNPEDLCMKLRQFRRGGLISHEISVVRDIRERELRLLTDAGRVCRPLFIIDYDEQRYWDLFIVALTRCSAWSLAKAL